MFRLDVSRTFLYGCYRVEATVSSELLLCKSLSACVFVIFYRVNNSMHPHKQSMFVHGCLLISK